MLKVFSKDSKESVAEESPKEVAENVQPQSEPQEVGPAQSEEPKKVE
jgi:hypothetical protein